jgi:hypothetical protein
MTVRLAAAIPLLLALASAAAAQDGDVRVILPLPLDAKPDTTFERVGPGAAEPKHPDVADICNLIAASADEHGLPRPFFARLIWKESRFDANAVSPTGAQGIAQFMPGTAFMRGLRDAFDPEQAIPASAKYLADLRRDFGNLGLAAAAYNAGEERVSGWLADGGFLPTETEDYVLSILGKAADEFRDLTTDEEQKPLDEKKPFEEACRALPVMRTAAAPFAGTPKPVWGAQVAGHFKQAVALRQWKRVRARHAQILGDKEPAVFRARSPIGRKQLYVVQIGAPDRAGASKICDSLRRAGGSCVVVKN